MICASAAAILAYGMSITEEQLISEHIGLVRRLAVQLAARLPANVELDDLLQAGLMGLMDAARRYQHDPEAQFETYATTRIRGAMLDELRSQDWLPRSVRSKARAIEQAITQLSHRLLRPPFEREIAEEMGLSIEDYRRLLEEARGVQVIHFEDLLEGQDRRGQRQDEFAVTEQATMNEGAPFGSMVRDGLRKAIQEAINELPERERLLLSLQFEQDLTQKEIAAVLGLTEGRISQLRSQAIVRLRTSLASAGWTNKPGEIAFDALL